MEIDHSLILASNMVNPVPQSPLVPDGPENSAKTKDLEYKCAIDGDDENDGRCSGHDDDDGDEFEFSFVPQGQDVDDHFGDGQRHPVYPVFGQSFVHDGGDEVVDLTSSFQELSVQGNTASGEGEPALSADCYCAWNPQMGTPPPLDASKKSRSTGTSSSRKWKLMDLMVGRSHSDGKEKFRFLTPPNATAERKKTVAKKAVKEMDMRTAHNMYYGKGGAGDRKQSSYLPYRRGLVGFRPF